jgi:hypothetical protein
MLWAHGAWKEMTHGLDRDSLLRVLNLGDPRRQGGGAPQA